MKIIGSAFVCMAFAFGCGGGSGLDSNLALADLSAAEIDEVCSSVAPRVVDCGDFEIEFSVESCVDSLLDIPDTCDATIGDQDACAADLDAQSDDELCDFETPFPASCEPLFDDSCLPDQ